MSKASDLPTGPPGRGNDSATTKSCRVLSGQAEGSVAKRATTHQNSPGSDTYVAYRKSNGQHNGFGHLL